jgi:hypothetical protein
LKSVLKNSLINFRGTRISDKIIVIESDDWGSIRMSNAKSLSYLKSIGIRVDDCPYMLNDSLESNQDMVNLFDLIESKVNSPVITANFLTANPNFEEIRNCNFEKYHFELVEKTLSRYPNHDNVMNLYIEGLRSGYFVPQLHGREHLNINRWMNDLVNKNKETLFAFDHQIFGVSANAVIKPRGSYQAVFDSCQINSYASNDVILEDAVSQFSNMFGFNSVSFIAPNYIWDSEIERTLSRLGVKYLQGTHVQRLPRSANEKLNVVRHWLGQPNRFGQKYLVRNASFEPFQNPSFDWVSSCLKQIENSFFWNKPAIISMHRVNFVGSINPQNSYRNLKLFSRLLDEINKKWPDVKFLSTKDLAELI